MRKINYVELAKEALFLSLRNRNLWILGILISLPGTILETADLIGITGNGQEKWPAFLKSLSTGTAAAIIFAVCAAAALIALSVLSQAGLILSINDKLSGKPSKLKDALLAGKEIFWKIVSLDGIVLLSVIAFVSILAFPVAAISNNGNRIATAAIAIPALLMMIGGVLLSMLIMNLGQLYVALGKIGTIDAIEKAYLLIKARYQEMMRILLLFAALAMITYLLMVTISALSIAIGIGMATAIGKDAGDTAATLGASVAAIVMTMSARSLYAVMIQAIWVLFFRKIASQDRRLAEESSLERESSAAVSAPGQTVASQRNE